jgi:uncharacterized membrane protein
MNCKKLAVSLSFAFLLCLSSAFAQTYTFTTVNYSGDTFTQLLGISNNNIIAGYHGFSINKGFTYSKGKFTDENYPGSTQTQVVGINGNGSKTSGFFISKAGVTEGFTDAESFRAVNYPGSAFNQLLSQNDNGQAAGYYSLSTSGAPDVPYVFDEFGGVFEVLYIPGSTNAQATGINDENDVCGFFVDESGAMHGWLLVGGVFTTLNNPNGSGTTAALGLNNKSQVVGTYVDSAGGTHGFVYSTTAQTWQTIDDPSGVGNTTVNGINDAGTLVGFYGPSACGTNDCSGFIAKP